MNQFWLWNRKTIFINLIVLGLGVTSLGMISCTKQNVQAQQYSTLQTEVQSVIPTETPRADVPYVPTANEVVEQMLKMAKVSGKDIVYDLGSGDGRIPITAVKKYNALRATGVEINPDLVKKSQDNAKKAGVSLVIPYTCPTFITVCTIDSCMYFY